MMRIRSNRWLLMIIAFFVSCLVWYMVVSHMNPEITLHLGNSQVSLQQTDSGQAGYAYYIEDHSSVGITVEVPQLKAACLGVDDFRITADVSACKEGENLLPLEVDIIKNRSVIGNKYSLNHDQITVRAERLITKEVDAQITVIGKPARGMAAGDPILKHTSVQLRVPSSLADKEYRVYGQIDITDQSTTITNQVALSVMNEFGEAVNCEEQQIYLNQRTIETTIPIGSEGTVKIKLPSEDSYLTKGYACSQIKGNLETVSVIGPEDVIGGLKRIQLAPPDLDLDERTESYSRKIYLQDYLPRQVYIKSKDQKILQVDVEIEALKERRISVSSDRISLTGFEGGDKGRILSSSVMVTLHGKESIIDSLKADDFSLTVNVAGLGYGEHEVTPLVMLPHMIEDRYCEVASCSTIRVKVSGS